MQSRRSKSRAKRPKVRAKRLGLLHRILKRRQYYSIAEAGEKIDLNRAQSYKAARLGEIPVEQQGRLMLVPRRAWDAKVRRLLAAVRPKKQPVARIRAEAASISPPEAA